MAGGVVDCSITGVIAMNDLDSELYLYFNINPRQFLDLQRHGWNSLLLSCIIFFCSCIRIFK